MIPDFEYFIRMRVKSIYSHTLPGLFWFDLPLGLISVLIYWLLIKDKLIDHLPKMLNKRFSPYKGSLKLSFTAIAIICLSVIIGAVSHIIWDGFTHPQGYFVIHIPPLSAIIDLGSHHIYVYKLIQHGSTLIGSVIILIVVLLLPEGSDTKSVGTTKYWLITALVTGLTILARLLTGLTFHEYGNLIVSIIAGWMLGLIITSFAVTNPRVNI